ncbi:MAG TPA: FAD-dependent oxidoreductase [Burkholderiales bacterium]|nr:FAD-dependent oxidoreductase [Burkholderiales bacterium]
MGEIRVGIVGAGIAGLTAALRLAERGYKVTVYEQRVFIGGKLGAHRHRLVRLVDPREVADSVWELERGTFPRILREQLQDQLSETHQRLEASLGVKLRREDFILSSQIDVTQKQTRKGQPHEWRVTDSERDESYAVVHEHRNSHRLALYDGVYHEHCYHMFLNWYHNFWNLVQDVGIDRYQAFSPKTHCAHLFRGASPCSQRLRRLTNLGAPQYIWPNLLSGVAPPADVFLWAYSILDLLTEPLRPADYVDQASVNGFVRSRWYATERCAELNDYLLTKAFAVPSYLTSARAFKSYNKYSMRDPVPMLWILNGNSHDHLFARIQERLEQLGGEIATGQQVKGLCLDAQGRIEAVTWEPSDVFRRPGENRPPSRAEVVMQRDRAALAGGAPREEIRRDGVDYLILAVPPSQLVHLVEPIHDAVPELQSVRKLEGAVTASLDVYFKRKLDDVPPLHVVLRDSRYGLTFADNSEAWAGDSGMTKHGKPVTFLNVAATDFPMLEGMTRDEITKHMIEELRHYVRFEIEDIDWGKTYLQRNVDEPLFLNEVGSERWRPKATTEIANLFLAGDFCDGPINVVTVEGAVVTGLKAAKALQERVASDGRVDPGDRRLDPIEAVTPASYSTLGIKALKLLLAPYVVAAKAWAHADDLARAPAQVFSPQVLRSIGLETLAAPAAYAADWWSFAVEAARSLTRRSPAEEDQE